MRGRKWEDSEIQFLKDNMATMTNKELAKALNRNIGSIVSKTSKMGMPRKHNKKWTEEEYQFLRDNAGKMTNKEIAEKLDRNIGSIAKLIPEMGLERKKPHKKWQDSEVQFLKDNVSTMTNKELSKALNRNINSVAAKIAELDLANTIRYSGGRKKWQDSEIQFMKDVADKMTNKEIAEILGRSIGSVSLKICQMGLTRKNVKKPWTEEDVNFLQENIKRMTYVEMGNKLGRTADCVRAKAKNLGIDKKHSSNLENLRSWTKEEEDYMKNHLDSTNKEIAMALNRTIPSVRCKKRQMGLTEQISGIKEAKMREAKWTKDNLYFLVSSRSKFGFDFISAFLGISELECQRKYLSLSERDKQNILTDFEKQKKLV